MLLSREDVSKSIKHFGNKKVANLKDDEKLMMEKQRRQEELFKRFNLGENVENIIVNVAKNRNGQTKEITLHFFKNYGEFIQPTKEFMEQMRKISELTIEKMNEM